MFKITRNVAVTTATFAALAATAIPSFASNTIATFADSLKGTATVLTYTDSGTKTIYVTSPSSSGLANFIDDGNGPVANTLTLSNLTSAGGFFHNGNGTYTQVFNGGNFTFNNGTDLLSGTFTGGSLTGSVGNAAATFTSTGNNVTYTSGTDLAQDGLPNNTIGSFAFSLSGSDSGAAGAGLQIDAANDGFASFVSNGFGGTFDSAVPLGTMTPEPTTTAAMGIGLLGVFGLGMLSRRRKSTLA